MANLFQPHVDGKDRSVRICWDSLSVDINKDELETKFKAFGSIEAWKINKPGVITAQYYDVSSAVIFTHFFVDIVL